MWGGDYEDEGKVGELGLLLEESGRSEGEEGRGALDNISTWVKKKKKKR